MNSVSAIHALPFDPTFEQIPREEAETTRQLVEAMHNILETTSQDYQHGMRSVHAKRHGLLDGELTVLADR
ncbi:hypothetical protein SAMN05443245_6948 [Paraburkholderia fungorum]|uniref:Catalase n=1 Tax=Paraburkholderia fungorum TaxID=134537 RepID=A0A1H1JP90_9BURK|nr:hypothetical protein [Paraburkholderia fungorum]SDR51509.1 hypothetical protein SAMN05443245_6948 [Paraburkholderia fungorum]